MSNIKPLRPRETFSPRQCRAARALLNWPVHMLASSAALEAEAVELFEAGDAELADDEHAAIGRALSAAGVVAIPAGSAGEGVRLRQPAMGGVPPLAQSAASVIRQLHGEAALDADFG